MKSAMKIKVVSDGFVSRFPSLTLPYDEMKRYIIAFHATKVEEVNQDDPYMPTPAQWEATPSAKFAFTDWDGHCYGCRQRPRRGVTVWYDGDEVVYFGKIDNPVKWRNSLRKRPE